MRVATVQVYTVYFPFLFLVNHFPYLFTLRFLFIVFFSMPGRIEDHAQDPEKPPILIFPEGICLNNTAVVQFKKGAFEVITRKTHLAIYLTLIMFLMIKRTF